MIQNSDDIRIVLVEPRHPGNIGAAARAMKTMGLDSLHLVSPIDHPSFEAERRAVSAADVLANARVVDRVEDAIGDCTLVMGTTARNRDHSHPLLDVRAAGRRLYAEASAGGRVAVLFGGERDGLSNRSLDHCGFEVRIPTGPELSSLNLASAVQIVCYEILSASQGDPEMIRELAVDPAMYPTERELEFFFARLRAILDDRGYFDSVNATPTFTKIRRLFGRLRPTSDDLSLLHGLVKMMRKGE